MVPGAPLLDALPTEEVTRCETEDDNAQLCGGCARLTAPKAALLDWAVRSEPHGGWGARGEAQQDEHVQRAHGARAPFAAHELPHARREGAEAPPPGRFAFFSASSVLVKAAPVTN